MVASYISILYIARDAINFIAPQNMDATASKKEKRKRNDKK